MSDLWALLRDKRRPIARIANKARCPACEQRVGLCVVQPSSTSAALALPKETKLRWYEVDAVIVLSHFHGPCGDIRSPVTAGALPKQGAPTSENHFKRISGNVLAQAFQR